MEKRPLDYMQTLDVQQLKNTLENPNIKAEILQLFITTPNKDVIYPFLAELVELSDLEFTEFFCKKK